MNAMISSSVGRLRTVSNDLDASAFGTFAVLAAAIVAMAVSALLG